MTGNQETRGVHSSSTTDLLWGPGQVAFPLWASVSSLCIEEGEHALMSLPALLVCGFLPSWGWRIPSGDSVLSRSRVTLSSIPSASLYSTSGSGRLDIFV